MTNAIAAVRNGIPVKTAANSFAVPMMTFLYKSKGKSPEVCKMGPNTSLTDEERILILVLVLVLV